MKQFFIKAAVFSFLIVFTIFGVIYLLPVDPDRYIMAIVDKHRILETTPQPRLILAGDSTLAFGLDSAAVKRATGYNVVNMGLIGGLGFLYSMDELKPSLRKNDIVILIPEIGHYAGRGIGDNTLVEVTIVLPKILCTLSRDNIKPFITSIPLTFQRRLRGSISTSKENPGYRRSGFNEYGDNTGHLELPPPVWKDVESVARFIPGMAGKEVTKILPERVNDELAVRMNEFAAYCEARGIEVYLSFSSAMEWKDRRKEEGMLQNLEKDMRSRIHMKIIGSPVSYILPRDHFYDNEFHLNKKGREARTKILIESMKKDPLLSSAPKR